MKKRIRAILGMCLAASMIIVSACGSSSGGAGDQGEVIKIGMVADLTGKSALTGEFKKRGAQIALDEINGAGGVDGKKIELVVEDDRGTNDGTVSAFQKLISDPDIVAIIGPITSTNALSINEITKKTGIPVMIGGTNVNLTTELKNQWFFRFRPSDAYSAKTIVDFSTVKLGKKKVAIVYDTDAFGTAGKDMLVAEYKNKGITPVLIEGYTANTKDFTPVLENIRKSGADVINGFMTASADVAQLVVQMRQLGIQAEFVSSAAGAQTTTLKLAGDKLNGIYGVNDFALDQSEETKRFVENFKQKYTDVPDLFSGWVYDALHVLAKVMAEKGTSPDQIREGILAVKGHKGVEGEYNFDPNGDGLHSYTVVQVVNGEIVTVK
ncbi:amino acid ABC transporter substrate-binding protein [Paenibacillus naphthalenovorans]|uniref:ABC transporter substrate-binding protein n=1 Tax=Paenibacillus naphthalenovorans TaxID=162209 RepID=UPI0010B1ECE5|nr:ABC transporter substrate-binding protein [Paenibacillus naphthalenovorans]GCL71989.1 amino acid ABC transporter substrate-binding protein [Paenibacillus naphthalenovorans]